LVLAPGEGITGAAPGGGTIALTGSSFATPLVSGVAALLLSIQRRIDGRIDPRAVADAILRTAAKCDPPDAAECHRYLAGIINISGAHASISKGERIVADLNSGVRAASVEIPSGSDGSPEAAAETNAPTIADGGVTTMANAVASGSAGQSAGSESPVTAVTASATPPSSAAPGVAPAAGAAPGITPAVGAAPAAGAAQGVAPAAGAPVGVAPAVSAASVAPSGDCNCKRPGTTSYVYAIGQIRYDLESDANRDALRQLMPEVVRDDLDPPVRVQPNPYDVFQLVDYLNQRPSESTKLVWTLNLDLTPIYAIEAEVAYPEEVYSTLREALRNGALPTDDENYVSRASIPGVLTDRTIQLYSGQVVPVVVAQARGLYTWKEAALINGVIEALRPTHPDMDENYVRQLTRIFLDKVYYECRNLGVTAPDRALNFAATNAYQVGSAIARGITSGQLVPGSEGELFTLDSIEVTKSPYCRMDSDCWDVRIKFFSPENDRRAKSVYQFTIDVSREMPVSLAPEHQFLTT
jgi:cyanobactin maturation PatA/PatG family protease